MSVNQTPELPPGPKLMTVHRILRAQELDKITNPTPEERKELTDLFLMIDIDFYEQATKQRHPNRWKYE